MGAIGTGPGATSGAASTRPSAAATGIRRGATGPGSSANRAASASSGAVSRNGMPICLSKGSLPSSWECRWQAAIG